VYIVETPYDHVRLAGASALEWLRKAFELIPHAVVPSEAEIKVREDATYVAVIPTSMPLVTAEMTEELLLDMEKRAIDALEIGNGKLLSKEACRVNVFPKRRVQMPAFRTVEQEEDRALVERELFRRNACFSVQNGAIIPDVDSVRIDFGSEIRKGAFIAPYTFVTESVIGENAVVGPFSEITRARVDEGATVTYSVVRDSCIGKGTSVGPFAYVRMGSAIGDKCRIGDFVEVKKSFVADGAKAAHLTYIGDAEVGLGTNIGCGTVFANYDGEKKHKTRVGSHTFIGANTNLIAPIQVGDDVFIAAATTVTKDVPDGSFVIGRSRAEIKKRE